MVAHLVDVVLEPLLHEPPAALHRPRFVALWRGDEIGWERLYCQFFPRPYQSSPF